MCKNFITNDFNSPAKTIISFRGKRKSMIKQLENTVKVLIIAYPELAGSVKAVLTEGLEFPIKESNISTFFPANPDNLTIPSSGLLCKEVFSVSPKSADSDKPQIERGLFTWREYDYVIIQDRWLWTEECREIKLSTQNNFEKSRVDYTGYVLARSCYYLWGNFKTKFIILVTDKNFLSLDAPAPDAIVDYQNEIFDEKKAFELVKLISDSSANNERNAVERFRDIFSPNYSEAIRAEYIPVKRKKAGNQNIKDLVKELHSPVMTQIKEALRLYVKDSVDKFIYVDDEIEDLKKGYKEIIGEEPIVNYNTDSGRKVEMALYSKDGKCSSGEAYNFEGLFNLCENTLEKSDGKFTLLITDILFKIPSWKESGVDLIERLRAKSTEDKPLPIGIIAFTGFTTPFISMFSYQKGADFVVSKGQSSGNSEHASITDSGMDQLLMAAAFLCFQRNFINYMSESVRRYIKNIVEGKNTEIHSVDIDQQHKSLKDILPAHSISQHLRQEWADICYLFEAAKIYKKSPQILDSINKDMNSGLRNET